MAGFSIETRTSHPSAAQVDVLLSFLETRLDLARGLSKIQSYRERGHKDWCRITLRLNNMPSGTVKTVKRWMKYWSDKKSAVKKKQLLIEKNLQEGNIEEVPELSKIDERILRLLRACANATSSQLYRRRVKMEPIEQQTVESSQSRILGTLLLTDPIGENCTEDNNDSEDGYISAHSLNGPTDTSQSQQENHTDTNTNPRLSPPPGPAEQQSTFMLVADKLCHIEQQRLELDRRMMDVVERNSERDLLLAEAVKAMGEGLKALAAAITRN